MNSMCQTIGLVLFVTLFLTIDLVFRNRIRSRDIALIGLLISAICAVRDNYIPAAFLIVGLCFLLSRQVGSIRGRVAAAGFASLTALVFLSPWMILLQRSSNSWLYPIIRGNHQPTFETYSAGFGQVNPLKVMGEFFVYPATIIVLAPAILFALSARSRTAIAQIAGGVVTAALTALLFTYSNDDSLFRYAHGYLVAAFLTSLLAAVEFRKGGARRSKASDHQFGIALALLIVVIPSFIGGQAFYLDTLKRLPEAMRHGDSLYSRTDGDDYLQVEASVPIDAKVLAMVTLPSLFDYSRHIILNVDIPGAASPSPGMPFFKGPQALKAYLKNLGIDYIAYSDFDSPNCLYFRSRWLCQRDSTKCEAPAAAPGFCAGLPPHLSEGQIWPVNPKNREAAMWKSWAPFYLDLMSNLDRLAQTESMLVCNARLRLLRLN
jgi:hypothetical protein